VNRKRIRISHICSLLFISFSFVGHTYYYDIQSTIIHVRSAGGWISRVYLSSSDYGGKSYDGSEYIHSLVTSINLKMNVNDDVMVPGAGKVAMMVSDP